MKAIFLVLLCASLVSAETYYAEESPVNSVVEFMKGLFEAMNEQNKFQHVVSCITGCNELIKEFTEIWNIIKNFDSSKLMELAKHIVSTAWKTYHYVTGCKGALDELVKLWNTLISVNIVRVLSTLVWNFKVILVYITDLINAANALNAGKALGHIIYKILLEGYLVPTIEFSVRELADFIEAFFTQILNKKIFDNLELCIENMPNIADELMEAIRKFKYINWANPKELLETFGYLFSVLADMMVKLKKCTSAPEILEKVIHKVISTGLQDLLQRLIKYAFQVTAAFTTLLSDLQQHNYKEAGKNLGLIFYYLIYDGQVEL